jgi:hypothetical protein
MAETTNDGGPYYCWCGTRMRYSDMRWRCSAHGPQDRLYQPFKPAETTVWQ